MKNWTRPLVGVGLAGALVLGGMGLASPSGASDPLGQITVRATGGSTAGFTADVHPGSITLGPDGLIWFLEVAGGEPPAPPLSAAPSGLGMDGRGAVARRNADGSISEFTAGITGSSLADIAAGPDGNLWFTEFNSPGAIAKITPAGAITEVAIGGQDGFPSGNVEAIVAGPDGNLWYTQPFPAGTVGTISPSGAFTTLPRPDDSAQPRDITVGPDGNLWFTDDGGGAGRIWRVTPGGTYTLMATAGVTPGLPAGQFIYHIVTGPDGALWFTGSDRIGRITTAGSVTTFSDPGLAAGVLFTGITSACGALYASVGEEEGSASAVWRSTTAGVLTPYTSGIPAQANPQGITTGADDDAWFTGSSDPGRVMSLGTGCTTPPDSTTTTAPTTSTTAPGPAPAAAVRVTPRFTG